MKYAYPALIRPEKVGSKTVNSVLFPDICRGGTSGNDLPEALEMAADWLAGTLCDMEKSKEEIPKPSNPSDIETEPGDIVTLVFADTIAYRKKMSPKSMNKMLTIPIWLNTIAEDNDVNFSQTLQRALKAELGLTS